MQVFVLGDFPLQLLGIGGGAVGGQIGVLGGGGGVPTADIRLDLLGRKVE
ncbi:MAG: hypothetical protein IPL28_05840 [Chloroflexi bacterium]|nr:hypothetical protein [Chloroflexota bacterium]